MTAKHSPLPWSKDPLYGVISSTDGIQVARCWGEDAALIVRAVNDHERLTRINAELVEACTALVTACDTAKPLELIAAISKATEMARAALRKAEGEG